MLLRKIFLLIIFIYPSYNYAHGSMEIPISRIYNCYLEGPENVKSEACKAVVAAGGKQPLYDWDMVNQANANDQSRKIIPDGTLCAGGQDKYKGLNLTRNDWVTTTIKANANGNFNFVFRVTVPHATKYFQFYLTKNSYNTMQPLKWSDLEDKPFCTVNTVKVENGRYNFNCPLPKTSGRKILYMIWQRSDSPEAFYSCSDIVIGNITNIPWNPINALTSYSSLPVGTKIYFWLMKNCNEVESYVYTVAANGTSQNSWPFYLAQFINNQSSFTRIGQLNQQTGVVTPIVSATANQVYVRDDVVQPYFYMIDFVLPNQLLKFNAKERKYFCTNSTNNFLMIH